MADANFYWEDTFQNQNLLFSPELKNIEYQVEKQDLKKIKFNVKNFSEISNKKISKMMIKLSKIKVWKKFMTKLEVS